MTRKEEGKKRWMGEIQFQLDGFMHNNESGKNLLKGAEIILPFDSKDNYNLSDYFIENAGWLGLDEIYSVRYIPTVMAKLWEPFRKFEVVHWKNGKVETMKFYNGVRMGKSIHFGDSVWQVYVANPVNMEPQPPQDKFWYANIEFKPLISK